MNLRITIEADTASPALARTLDALEDKQPLLGAMGRRVVRDTSRHVAEWGLDHPNKLGGRRTNYWAGIAQRINPADTLSVSSEGALMELGGEEMPGIMRAVGPVTIVPGTKTPGVKYIPLPARSESYGLKPREFGTALMLFWGKAGPAGLAEAIPVTRTKKTKAGPKGSTYYRTGLVFYWFREEVTQPQDRSLLPSDAAWSDSANAAAGEWLTHELKKAKGGGA